MEIDDFLCPKSQQLMVNPVLISRGIEFFTWDLESAKNDSTVTIIAEDTAKENCIKLFIKEEEFSEKYSVQIKCWKEKKGKSLMESGRVEEAGEYNYIPALIKSAKSLFEDKNYQSSLETCLKCIELGSKEVYFETANLFEYFKLDADEAIKYYELFLKDGDKTKISKIRQSFMSLFVLYFRKGNHDKRCINSIKKYFRLFNEEEPLDISLERFIYGLRYLCLTIFKSPTKNIGNDNLSKAILYAQELIVEEPDIFSPNVCSVEMIRERKVDLKNMILECLFLGFKIASSNGDLILAIKFLNRAEKLDSQISTLSIGKIRETMKTINFEFKSVGFSEEFPKLSLGKQDDLVISEGGKKGLLDAEMSEPSVNENNLDISSSSKCSKKRKYFQVRKEGETKDWSQLRVFNDRKKAKDLVFPDKKEDLRWHNRVNNKFRIQQKKIEGDGEKDYFTLYNYEWRTIEIEQNPNIPHSDLVTTKKVKCTESSEWMVSYILSNGKEIFLGLFKNEKEADKKIKEISIEK